MSVIVSLPGTGLKICGKTRDVSAGGLFFYADLPVAEQQEIEVMMTLPRELTPAHVQVACRAKILRIERDGISGRTGMAAAIQQFDFLTELRTAELRQHRM